MRTTLLGRLKGGVGCSTLSLNLAQSAAHDLGLRVAVLDSDPQATVSEAAGVYPDDDVLTLADAYAAWRDGDAVDLNELVIDGPGGWAFSLIPSDIRLVAAEGSRAPGDERMLGTMLDTLSDRFDWLLCDAPSSIGVLTTNLVNATDDCALVTRPDRAALSATSIWLDYVTAVRREPPTHFVSSALINAVDQRRRETRLRLEELESWAPHAGETHTYGGVGGPPITLHQPYLPERAVINESFGTGIPLRRAPASAARDEAQAHFDALSAALWNNDRKDAR